MKHGYTDINRTRQICPKCGRNTYIYTKSERKRFCTVCRWGTDWYDEARVPISRRS